MTLVRWILSEVRRQRTERMNHTVNLAQRHVYLGLSLQPLLAVQEPDTYDDNDSGDVNDSDAGNGCEEDPILVAEYHIFRVKMAVNVVHAADHAWSGSESGGIEVCGGRSSGVLSLLLALIVVNKRWGQSANS